MSHVTDFKMCIKIKIWWTWKFHWTTFSQKVK